MKSAIAFGILSQALSASAHPHHGTGNSNVHIAKRGVNLNSYRMQSIKTEYMDSYDFGNSTVAATAAADVAVKRSVNYIDVATKLVKTIVPSAQFRVINDSYVGQNGIAHVNFIQTANGLDIDNADFNVNIWPNGTIFSYGNSFYTGKIPKLSRRSTSTPEVATTGAIKTLDLPINSTSKLVAEKSKQDSNLYTIKGTSGAEADPKAKLVYIQNDDSSLSLAWRVETNVVENWLLSYVDATTNTKIHGVVDYVSDFAEYNVYPWGVWTPEDGKRSIQVDPWNANSPATWQGNGTYNFTDTRGNNGFAEENPTGPNTDPFRDSDYMPPWSNYYRPNEPNRVFNYPYNTSMANPKDYLNASITQLFYTANKYHDLLYTLGFTEQAGNFQDNNFGKGGKDNDAVMLFSHDASGTDNAFFSSPPDGEHPYMRTYMWTKSTPHRDSAFDASTVIHEYTHGLSSRLTGGPANARCLIYDEARGMGEGWSDFMAVALKVKKTDKRTTDYTVGSWISNNPKGIRAYPYSTSLTTNPYTYKDVRDLDIHEHSVGNVWGNILYEMLWNLIDKHGHPAGDVPVFKHGVPTDGKFLAMKLVIDAMALQPCNPDFVSARNAILDADRALTWGANRCLLWKAFAKRGVGKKAKYDRFFREENFDLPWFC